MGKTSLASLAAAATVFAGVLFNSGAGMADDKVAEGGSIYGTACSSDNRTVFYRADINVINGEGGEAFKKAYGEKATAMVKKAWDDTMKQYAYGSIVRNRPQFDKMVDDLSKAERGVEAQFQQETGVRILTDGYITGAAAGCPPIPAPVR